MNLCKQILLQPRDNAQIVINMIPKQEPRKENHFMSYFTVWRASENGDQRMKQMYRY